MCLDMFLVLSEFLFIGKLVVMFKNCWFGL